MDAKGQRPYLVYVSVQMDKTKESIEEIHKEFVSIIGSKPVSSEEFGRVQNNMLLQLPGMWETNSSVAGSLSEKVSFGLSDDYFKTYDSKIRNLNIDELNQIGKQVIKPDQIIYFVVGDKSKIYSSLKETGYEILEIDTDGKIIK
jgi:zinc protease